MPTSTTRTATHCSELWTAQSTTPRYAIMNYNISYYDYQFIYSTFALLSLGARTGTGGDAGDADVDAARWPPRHRHRYGINQQPYPSKHAHNAPIRAHPRNMHALARMHTCVPRGPQTHSCTHEHTHARMHTSTAVQCGQIATSLEDLACTVAGLVGSVVPGRMPNAMVDACLHFVSAVADGDVDAIRQVPPRGHICACMRAHARVHAHRSARMHTRRTRRNRG